MSDCTPIENSQWYFCIENYSEDVFAGKRGNVLKQYGAGGVKQLIQVLVFDIKTDGNVPRRVSLTN